MPEIQSREKEPEIIKMGEVEAKAEAIRKARELPKKPGDSVSFVDLTRWLRLLPPEVEQEKRIMIYVYRLDPVIQKQLVDATADNNIDVIFDGFQSLGEDYFVDRHGGGTYKLIVKDLDKPKEKRGGFFEARLTIPMQMYDPKLDLREVVWDHRDNKGFRIWARGKRLIDDNNVPIPQTGGKETSATNSGNPSEVVNAIKMGMDFVQKLSLQDQDRLKKQLAGEDSVGKGVMEILLEKMKQDDPNKALTMLAAIMKEFKPSPTPPPPDTLTPMVTMMTAFMAQMSEQNRIAQEASNKQFMLMIELLKKDNGSGEGKDEFDKMKSIMELAREIKGGGGSRSTAEVIVDGLSPIVGPALNIVSNIMAMRAHPQGTPQIPTVPTESGMGMTQQPQQPQQPQAQIPANEAMATIQQFGPLIVQHLGEEGWEFADWIRQGFGDSTVAGIAIKGADTLLAAAKSVPEFWNHVSNTYGEAHLKKWLESFCNYKEILAKLDAEAREEEE